MKTSRLLALAPFFFLTACGEKEVTPAAVAPGDVVEPWFVAEAPADARSIHAVRDLAQPGDSVTLSGLVMGREKPFVDDRAAFVLGDPEVLKHCGEIPGDECDTPWDVCCESAENKRIGTATIQLVGEDGRVLRQGLKGVGGLSELSRVTLTGTVAETSTAEALVINAASIHVMR
jgi:hypothetical protein